MTDSRRQLRLSKPASPLCIAFALLERPHIALGALSLSLAALLTIDVFVGRGGQLALGAAAFFVLLAFCFRAERTTRAGAVVVVLTATVFEVVGSVLWGVYRYRLGNLPLFVPPGHGLVYLAGVSFARTGLVTRNSRRFIAAVLCGAWIWALVGLTILGRHDIVGAFGVMVYSVFVFRSRAPALLASIFVIVAALEIYGTAIGTWEWAPFVPGLHLPNGNPPSGAVSGYVVFDLAALTLAPKLLSLLSYARTRPMPEREARLWPIAAVDE